MEGRLGIIDYTLEIPTNNKNQLSNFKPHVTYAKEVNTKQTFDLLYILSERLTVK